MNIQISNNRLISTKLVLKLLLVSFFFFPLSYARAPFCQARVCEKTCPERQYSPFLIEADAAAFFPLSSAVRRIYGTALPSFTLEFNWRFYKHWGVWLDGSYVFGNGHAMGYGHESTHLSFVPITAGAKYFYPLGESIDLYMGLGPCYSFLNTTDHSRHVHKKTSANNFGATVKTGFIYHCNKRVFLDFFFNYMFQTMHFHKTESDPFVYRHDVNLSSLQLGGGIGLEF
jgi:outer membrane protein